MRLYVSNAQIIMTHHDFPVRELGHKNPIGMLPGYSDYQIHCDFTPVLDDGENEQEMLGRLSRWISGREINMVAATPNKPRCFYCGTMNDADNVKCPQCGGEIR